MRFNVAITFPDSPQTPAVNVNVADDGTATLAQMQKPQAANISAIWANDGADKVVRSELRASGGAAVTNSAWNGKKIVLSAARNEVTNFNLVLEAKTGASKVSVSFSRLASAALNSVAGPGLAVIESQPATGDGVFDWTKRPIELFYVRYLQIKGLSFFGYPSYDERQVPTKLRRPFSPTDPKGIGTGTWADRPNHNAFYPDIAVPLELVPTFDIAAASNQSIWCDIYVPKTATPGLYTGVVTISEGSVTHQIPVELTVHKFTLPDVPTAKSMLFIGGAELNARFTGNKYLGGGDPGVAAVMPVYDRFFLLAHRHKLSLIGEMAWIDDDYAGVDQPGKSTLRRLLGSFYSAANGYDGPGVGQPNDIYSIGTYGTWGWDKASQAAMWQHTDAWERWFQANAPMIERFLYLTDEPAPAGYPQVEQWAGWMKANPGPGKALASMVTVPMIAADGSMPSLNAPCFPAGLSPKLLTQAAFQSLLKAGKRIYAYGGQRPCSGSDATEDEGAALRSRPWMQFKFGLPRWFQWYANSWGVDPASATNLFQVANTFGTISGVDASTGEASGSNGNGNLFYPGTDKLFPADSYGLNGPIASLRLKHWRRGVQDADYLAMAKAIDPVATAAIVQRMVPVALWEVDVQNVDDPTWQYGGPSWPSDPDAWEQARMDLAAIIERGK